MKHFSFSSPSNGCQSPYQFCSARLFLYKSATLAAPMKDGYCGQEVSFSTLWLSFTQTRIWTELNIALYCPHWSSPHAEKNAFHIGLQCPRTDQVLSKPCKAHLTCQNSKALTLRVPPFCTSAMYVSSWEDTDSIIFNDDIDTCTMEDAMNLNF